MKTQIPYHGWCFVCGNENPHSIGITMYVDDHGVLSAEFVLNEAQQGPPGHAHGGASAAILDEAMGLVVWAAGHQVAAVHVEVDYRQPLPLHAALTVTARVTRKERHKIFSVGEIRLADATIAVSGRGIYVPAPKLFENVKLESPT